MYLTDPSDSEHDGSEASEELRGRVAAFLQAFDYEQMGRFEFLEARFDEGLAWVHFPTDLGGLGLPRSLQLVVDHAFAKAGAPDNDPRRIAIGLGMAAPPILEFGTDDQKRRFLRSLWTGKEVWCQLFSEPDAGSDLAAVSTRAELVEGTWIINGQKVWTSAAHRADWAILIARTDPSLPKHAGLTFFLCDMSAQGVDVRPLRQLTGEAEFNEVFLTDVQIPDAFRLGRVGDGWRVANATLMSERISIGGSAAPRESGMVGVVSQTWRERPELRTPEIHDRLLMLWTESELARLTGERLRQALAVGQPGPEGSAMKLNFARLAQQLSGLELELLGAEGLRYSEWSMGLPEAVDMVGRDAGYRYLRAKGNSIEGGTSEILRNIIAERVLGMPPEARIDKDRPWKELPR